MLQKLQANDSRFKPVSFGPGLNIVVADKLASSRETDSRNGSGKSSLIEILQFLLGAKLEPKSYLKRPELQQHSFKLQLDWPSASNGITVGRSIRDHNEIHVAPNVWRPKSTLGGSAVFNLIEWQKVIERDLFNMPSEHPGISGRAMLAFYLRRIYSHAFNEAVKTHAQQSPAEASANIAYLLGWIGNSQLNIGISLIVMQQEGD